jgi:hypothetical protein
MGRAGGAVSGSKKRAHNGAVRAGRQYLTALGLCVCVCVCAEHKGRPPKGLPQKVCVGMWVCVLATGCHCCCVLLCVHRCSVPLKPDRVSWPCLILFWF